MISVLSLTELLNVHAFNAAEYWSPHYLTWEHFSPIINIDHKTSNIVKDVPFNPRHRVS